MKKMMTLVSAVMMAFAANAKEVVTVPFTGARVSVPARVRFIQGENYAFKVEAKDSVVARALQCSVKDGVLCFKFGNALEEGSVRYDEKKGVHYYGVSAIERDFDNMDEEFVITVVSPVLPDMKKSADFETVAVKSAAYKAGGEVAQNSND